MNNCVFCRILNGELPSSIVYQDDRCTAFMDIQPINTGHVIVIPNGHAQYLADLEPEIAARLFRVAQQIAAGLRRSEIKCEGMNLFLADGEAAGQEVLHVHLHIFPRYKGDGFGVRFGPGYETKPERNELDATAEQIRKEL